MKIANIDREGLHIFWMTWEISMKFLGNKSHKRAGLHTLFRRYIFGKAPRGVVKLTPAAFLRLKCKYTKMLHFVCTLPHFFGNRFMQWVCIELTFVNIYTSISGKSSLAFIYLGNDIIIIYSLFNNVVHIQFISLREK